jgi:hypothetical protein
MPGRSVADQGEGMRTHEISRAQFLSGVGAFGAAVATGSLLTACQGDDGDDGDDPSADPSGPPSSLKYRGVDYEVVEGEYPETGWSADRMRDDLGVIKDELHADSVSVFGTGVERLAATATEAAERGLHVWLQPRMEDVPRHEILDHLAETGRHAEELRRQGAEVDLSVGCEFVLFVPGILPGDNALERIENISKGNYDPQQMVRRLNDFIKQAANVGRSAFDGQLTYGSAHGDDVDWDLFDIVSVNYYSYHGRDRAAYAKDLASYYRWDKPVAITECGSCTFKGAPKRGGMGWDVVDYSKPVPEIKDGVVRSEATQARYFADVFEVFESMDLYAAMIYQFGSPDAPYRSDPRYDLDTASYGLVKPIWEQPYDPGNWHWERKQAFYTVADQFGRVRD